MRPIPIIFISIALITSASINIHTTSRTEKLLQVKAANAQDNQRRIEVYEGFLEEKIAKERRVLEEHYDSIRRHDEQVREISDRFYEANPGRGPESESRQRELANRAALAVMESADGDFTVRAIMEWLYIESRLQYDETSPVDARGVAQIQPRTGQWIAVAQAKITWDESKLYDPQYSIRLGVAHLKWLNKQYGGDKDMAYTAYNMGMAGAESFRASQRARGIQVASRGEYSRLIRKRAGEID